MTTIVIDFENCVIAADSRRTGTQVCQGGAGVLSYNTVLKVHRIGDYVFTGAGSSNELERQLTMFKLNGSLDTKFKGECSIAIAHMKGDTMQVDLYESTPRRLWIGFSVKSTVMLRRKGVMTLGSGSNYAFAGMVAGMTAEEAIVLASKCDPYTDANVTVEVLK
jgi:20S proteasome alpha/beta subunit